MYNSSSPRYYVSYVFEISDYIGGIYKTRAGSRLPPRPNDRINNFDEHRLLPRRGNLTCHPGHEFHAHEDHCGLSCRSYLRDGAPTVSKGCDFVRVVSFARLRENNRMNYIGAQLFQFTGLLTCMISTEN